MLWILNLLCSNMNTFDHIFALQTWIIQSWLMIQSCIIKVTVIVFYYLEFKIVKIKIKIYTSN